jgi:putative transposase
MLTVFVAAQVASPPLATSYRPKVMSTVPPYHVVQRSNNREACFVDTVNYQYYLELWKECISRCCVHVHAYCLMTNHVHFLVTPHEKDSISRAMQVVGSSYGYYFNKTYTRSGTVREGRHKSSLVQPDRCLLTCSRYIELDPVTAGMADKPEQYRWSSYLVNTWSRKA